jgi:hypothetical protein
MSNFDERRDAAEKKFGHDQELEFKAQARRARLLGQWAAELMGLTGDEAETFWKETVVSDLEQPGEEDLFAHIRKSFDKAGVAQSDHQIRARMAELLEEARIQVRA